MRQRLEWTREAQQTDDATRGAPAKTQITEILAHLHDTRVANIYLN